MKDILSSTAAATHVFCPINILPCFILSCGSECEGYRVYKLR